MNILEKLLAIRKTVPYLQKGEASGAGYNYTSSSQVLAAVRQKMDEHGIILISSVLSAVYHPKSGDNKMNMTELNMEMIWKDCDDPGSEIRIPWYAQGCDQAEKGVGKALTYAEKYFLLKEFNIATDKDDPDAFAETHGIQSEEKKKAQEDALSKVQADIAKIADADFLRQYYKENKAANKKWRSEYDRIVTARAREIEGEA